MTTPRQQEQFQSTRPLRGGTWATSRRTPSSSHFNPPAPCGAGRQILRGRGHGLYFNPPAPCGAGHRSPGCRDAARYFNPPAPCGAGPRQFRQIAAESDFNPPAPCGAGQGTALADSSSWNFNPPAPCGAGPCRGPCRRSPCPYFNPPAPCGAGLDAMTALNLRNISIHPPLAGRDSSYP